MAKGVNKVILIGSLGKDPEIKNVSQNLTVATLSIATSEQWKDAASGEKKEKTEWHRVVLFNKLGEIAGQYLKKGSKVYIEGKLETKKWTDKQGVERYTTQILGNSMQMLDGAKGGDRQPEPPAQAYEHATREHPAPLTDDDIPF